MHKNFKEIKCILSNHTNRDAKDLSTANGHCFFVLKKISMCEYKYYLRFRKLCCQIIIFKNCPANVITKFI